MKKILVVSAIAALGLSSVALAGGLPEEMPMAPAAIGSSEAGVYLGIQGGYGLSNWKIFSNNVEKDNGFVGRAFLGYDINKYFATEFGYTHFFNKVKINAVEIKNQTFDLVGKIKAPIADEVNLYAKLGADYMISKGDSNSEKNFGVAYGAGVDYSITPNVIVNLEWLRHNGRIKLSDNKLQPWTDAFLVGVRYKWDV